jgi:hypothetical protein
MTAEPASPVCWAGEADDAYLGYAPPAEVAAFLGEMLALERAIGRAGGGRLARRQALARLIRGLGQRPRGLAAVHGEALNQADRQMTERLRAMLPHIRDDRLHQALTALLTSG